MQGSEPDTDCLKGQKSLKKLSAYLRKSAIPHALLFTGAEGGETAARLFAMACNCEIGRTEDNPPSEHGGLLFQASCTCRSCRKIISGNHPDMHYVEPTGAMIRIDRIRELCDSLAMKPYEAGTRFAVISHAQSMNPGAANALLKMLEEPPDRTILILTAPQRSDLLPTIVSRCQEVRFTPMRRESMAALLTGKYGLSPGEADIMAMLSGGNMSEIGKSGAECRQHIRLRNWLLRISGDMMIPGHSVPAGTLLGVAEKLIQRKKNPEDCLDILVCWLRDLLVFPYAPRKIMNRDMTERIQNISEKTSVPLLLSKIRAVESARKSLQANANPRLTLEVLMLRLAKDEYA